MTRTALNSVACCLIACSTTAAGAGANREPEKFVFRQVRMGIVVELQVYGDDPAAANEAAAAAYARLKSIDWALSDYDPDSELMQLCRTAPPGVPVAVGPDLSAVLARSLDYARLTEGRFDVTIGPVVDLWRRARRSQMMPDPEKLSAALDRVGHNKLQFSADHRTVALAEKEMRLDFGGIAKGYAVDEALRVLAEHGFTQALVDAGGDLAVGDPPPGRTGWRVALESPGDEEARSIELVNAAVATSGDAYRFVEIDGVRYSHIVDPETGLGLTARSSVTVIAPKCLDADALATSVSVLRPDAGMKLIESTDDVEAFVIVAHGEAGYTRRQSPGFDRFVVDASPAVHDSQ